jgi:hypothetical protein
MSSQGSRLGTYRPLQLSVLWCSKCLGLCSEVVVVQSLSQTPVRLAYDMLSFALLWHVTMIHYFDIRTWFF